MRFISHRDENDMRRPRLQISSLKKAVKRRKQCRISDWKKQAGIRNNLKGGLGKKRQHDRETE